MTPEDETAAAGLMDRLLEAMYRRGYRRFFSGCALGFDLFASERVAALRARHGDVRLLLAIPCPDQTRGWKDAELRRYERVLCLADEMRVISRHYYQGCMMVRNRYMVDRSALCLCYLNKQKGGTMSTVAYAAREDLQLLNLAIPDLCADYIRETGVT